MVKKWLVLQGGNSDFRSPYATTSALSFRGTGYPERPPASPWMGEPQSRHGFMPSGYHNAFFRDKPPGSGELSDESQNRASFSRPKTTSLAETQPWAGEKDAEPFKSCLKRGEIKEPRFYPFKMGSDHGAHVLISPHEAEPKKRFEVPPYIFKGPIPPNSPIMKQKNGHSISSGFSTGNSSAEVAKLISERQGQSEFRPPALTMMQAERVAADSTARYFHARDYYENPFMSSNTYYQQDTLAQHEEMKRNKESLTAVPSTMPLTQYALFHNDAPYAPDVGEGVAPPVKRIGEGVSESWGKVAPEEERVGLLPTAFSRTKVVTTGATVDPGYPAPAPPLPERFAKIRERHDYLRWGSVLNGPSDRYMTTSRVELCKPSVQHPVGGSRYDKLPSGARVVGTDSSGYHMQNSANPITHDVGL